MDNSNLIIYEPTNDGESEVTANTYNYMTDSTMNNNIGIFHEEITLNPDDDQLAEYCGNFTFR